MYWWILTTKTKKITTKPIQNPIQNPIQKHNTKTQYKKQYKKRKRKTNTKKKRKIRLITCNSFFSLSLFRFKEKINIKKLIDNNRIEMTTVTNKFSHHNGEITSINYKNMKEQETNTNPDVGKSSVTTTIVTAFFNINRDEWNYAKRSVDHYLVSFKNWLYLYNHHKYNIILFMDDTILLNTKMQEIIKKFPRLNVIPINIEWLKENSLSWKKLDVAVRIMSSNFYKLLVSHRIIYNIPETIYPKYNVLNHCKIDLIKYAIDNKYICMENEFVCWLDFGYFGSVFHNRYHLFPYTGFDMNKFDYEKLHFCLCNKLTISDLNPYYTAIVAKNTFTGGFFAGMSNLLLEFHSLFHECLDELNKLNISDDDQHVYLRCFIKRPQLFELFLSEKKWPESVVYFQKPIKNRFALVYHYLTILNGNGKQIVEIGVGEGIMSRFILESKPNCKLHCVDPYISYPEYEDSYNIMLSDNKGNTMYEDIVKKFECFHNNNRVIFHRNFSREIIGLFDENSVDMVYIDANYKYNYVIEELNNWFPKVKSGGLIICDGAFDTDNENKNENDNETQNQMVHLTNGSWGKYGVIRACKDFSKKMDLPYYKFMSQILFFKM